MSVVVRIGTAPRTSASQRCATDGGGQRRLLHRPREMVVMHMVRPPDGMAGHTSVSGIVDDAVRRRWRTRRITGRAPVPREGTAPTFVIHVAPGTDPPGADGLSGLTLRTTADVIVRYHTMCGRPVQCVDVDGHKARTDDNPRDAAPARATTADLLALGRPDGQPRPYRPTDAAYVDSIWWAAAQLWDAGLLRERRPARPRCTDCGGGTPLGTATALVRFPVRGDNALRFVGASLLVATDHPETLAAVHGVRVSTGRGLALARAAGDDYPVVLARDAVPVVLGADATVDRAVDVAELDGLTVVRPGPVVDGAGGTVPVAAGPAHDAQEQLTGIVPVAGDHAPAGDGAPPADTSSTVLEALTAQGLLVDGHHVGRPAPRCRDCGGAMVAPDASWTLVTSAHAERLRSQRMAVRSIDTPRPRPWAVGTGDIVVAAPALRGAPMPVWRCDRCAHSSAVASRSDLAKRCDDPAYSLDGRSTLDLDVSFMCDQCNVGRMHRVPVRFDPLFDRAAMPFARFGFPAVPGSGTRLAHHSRADLAIDTDGAWLDARVTLATLLWHATDVVKGLCIGDDRPGAGDVLGVCRAYGADAVRWAMVAANSGERSAAALHDRARVARDRVVDPLRRAVVAMIAAADHLGWTVAELPDAPRLQDRPAADRTILAALASTVDAVRDDLDVPVVADASRHLARFVGDLVDWWSARQVALPNGVDPIDRGAEADAASALGTFHECLVTVAALLAPFTPFVSDEVYERVVRGPEPQAPDSVHLLRFPTADPAARSGVRADRRGPAPTPRVMR